MLRKITINSCKKKLNIKGPETKIKSKYKFIPNMDLIDTGERQIIFAGNRKLIFMFDSKTHHEIYKGNAKHFEILVFRKGFTKPTAYIDLDWVLTYCFGSDVNYESKKLRMLIAEWLYEYANTYETATYDFEELSKNLTLEISYIFARMFDKDYVKC